MYDKQLIVNSIDSLAETEPGPPVADAERALQLIESRSG